jgi:alpha-tubulin suppressor-like RCC1 family protein
MHPFRRTLLPLALALVAACADAPSLPPPGDVPAPAADLLRIDCVGDRAGLTLRCEAPDGRVPGRALILGGQGSYVTLASSGAAYVGGSFTFFTTVRNLLGQAMGTTNGTTGAPEGTRVFFAQPPTVASGTGTITVVPDGTGTFTGTNQAYYQYDGLLAPGATSAPKRWRLDMPATVGTFAFTVYVSTPVRWPDGWVDLGPASVTVPLAGTAGLTAVVRDRLGNPVPGETVTFASADGAIAGVDASTGLVTAAALGTTTVTATAGARTGTVSVKVVRPLNLFTVSPASGTVLVGATLQLGGLYRDTGNNFVFDRVPAYASSDTTRARVSATGLVTGIAPGAVTITATIEGLSSASNLTVTTSAAGLVQFAQLAAGSNHTCALTAAGAAYCWGPNMDGQLGNGRSGTSGAEYRNAPSAVVGGLTFSSLVSGAARTCGLAAGGAAYCWGYNLNGGLGTGDTVHAESPTPVSGGLSFTQLSVGADHTCGVAGGAAYCWGRNSFRQLGTGGTDAALVPTPVSGGLTFTAVAAGWDHSCGLTPAGAAYCWGTNGQGQLGNGTQTASAVPVPVHGGHVFASIATGMQVTCAVTTAGKAYCWGTNAFSELGNGGETTSTSSYVPVPVSGGITWASVTLATRPTVCGVATSGAAYCWGRNDGASMLGVGGAVGSSKVPLAVAGGLSFASLSAGGIQTCGITTGGHAYCWGTANNGALGDGTYTNRGFPTPVAKGAAP